MKEVLDKIKPSRKEKHIVNKIIKQFISKLKFKDAQVILGGSGAKGTWLSSKHDVDIFVMFNYKKFKSKSDAPTELLAQPPEQLGAIQPSYGGRPDLVNQQDMYEMFQGLGQ